jgi:hypothetical protein
MRRRKEGWWCCVPHVLMYGTKYTRTYPRWTPPVSALLCPPHGTVSIQHTPTGDGNVHDIVQQQEGCSLCRGEPLRWFWTVWTEWPAVVYSSRRRVGGGRRGKGERGQSMCLGNRRGGGGG